MTRKLNNNCMQEKQNNFGVKYGNEENIQKKSRMDKQHSKSCRNTRRRTESKNTHRFTQNSTKEDKHFLFFCAMAQW